MNRFFGLLIIIALLIYSCKSNIIPVFKQSNINGEYIYNEVKLHEVPFKTFSFKYNAKVKLPEQKYHITGQVKIIRDSIIWASISPMLGIEMVRVILFPDTLIFIDRLHSSYYIGDYSYVKKLFYLNFDFYTFQSILINEFFVYPIHGKRQRNFTRYKASKEHELYKLQPDNTHDTLYNNYSKILQTLFIHPDLYKILKVNLADTSTGNQFDVIFSDYINIENSKFPQNVLLNFTTLKDSVTIDIKYVKISVNTELNFNNKIPEKYNRIY